MSEWQSPSTAPLDEPVLVLFPAISMGGVRGPKHYVWAGRRVRIKSRTVWVGLDDDENQIGEPLAWSKWPQPPSLPLHGEDE